MILECDPELAASSRSNPDFGGRKIEDRAQLGGQPRGQIAQCYGRSGQSPLRIRHEGACSSGTKTHAEKVEPAGGSDQKRTEELPYKKQTRLGNDLSPMPELFHRVPKIEDELATSIRENPLRFGGANDTVIAESPDRLHNSCERRRWFLFAITKRHGVSRKKSCSACASLGSETFSKG
jgi:hypothetical protein